MTKVVNFADYRKSARKAKPPKPVENCGLSLEGLFSAAFVSWYECDDEELGDYFLSVLNQAWAAGEWVGYVTQAAYDQYVTYAKSKSRVVHPHIPATE